MKPYTLHTYGELFSGFGGWGEGAKQLGLRPLWALEKDKRIATVYQWNNPQAKVWVRDAITFDYRQLQPVDVLFASPPCQAFSIARSAYTQHPDRHLALFIVDAVQAAQPQLVFIENVPLFSRSKPYLRTIKDIMDLGYEAVELKVDAVDYGVPQTRLRVFCILYRGPLPALNEQFKRIAWLEAMQDIIDRQYDDDLMDWHYRSLPITSTRAAFEYFSNNYSAKKVRISQRYHVTTENEFRAFAIAGYYSGRRGLTVRADFHPFFTVVASTAKQSARLLLADGTVKKLRPRGYARIQTFPDDYELPALATLAGRGIGNAVPPLQARRLLEPFVYG